MIFNISFIQQSKTCLSSQIFKENMVFEVPLIVTTNSSLEIKKHLNESAIIYEVITKLILLLTNDLKMKVKFDADKDDQNTSDIYINFDEDDNVNSTSLWPYYQDRYCFVYSNSKKLTFYRSFITTMTLKDYLILATPIAITIIYHFLVLRFRLKKTIFDAFWTAYLYALQTFTNGSTPNLDKYPHDKFFLTGLYIFIFVAMFTFLTFFSSHCTVPRFLPAADQELAGIRKIEYTQSFGIGEECVSEIIMGAFERRSCMVPCFKAISITTAIQQIKITNEINFRNVLKVSKNSKFFHEIKALLTHYNEVGVLETMFEEIHQKSYRHLTTSTHNPVLTVEEVRVFILNAYVIGVFESLLSFGVEITIWVTTTFVIPIYRGLRRSYSKIFV